VTVRFEFRKADAYKLVYMDVGEGDTENPVMHFAELRDARAERNRNGTGVRDTEVESGGPASLPIVLELAVEVAAAEGNDSVGPADCPEHSGLLEAGTDDGLAAGFDDAGADK
jgi:hypothetical protein